MLRPFLLLAVLAAIASGEEAAVTALKAQLSTAIAGMAADDKVKAFVTTNLLPLTTDATWVAEVAAQNGKQVTLDEIKKIDAQWQKAEEELPIQREKLGNATAKSCVALAKKLPALREIFVMDNQGANVGQNELTSDYWQGDEDKWSKSFNGGKGGVDVGKVKFDQSANVSLQQVSLPIIAADGTVIGAVCFGIDVGAL
jgi:hypothetical protein